MPCSGRLPVPGICISHPTTLKARYSLANQLQDTPARGIGLIADVLFIGSNNFFLLFGAHS